MTVLPGSLDYLYYNGILDHIPYEAYQYGFGSQNPYMINPYSGLKQAYLNGSDYLNAAQGGHAYKTYNSDTYMSEYGGNIYDSSTNYNPYGPQIGIDSDYNSRLNDKKAKGKFRSKIHQAHMNFRESILNTAASFKENVLDSSSFWKGLLALGLIIATPILIIKGMKKPPVQTQKQSFWSKLNPKNWFKK